MTALLGGAACVSADQIKLKNGRRYDDATITSRNASNLQVRVQFGTIEIPIASVESLNGAGIEEAATAQAPTPYVHNWKMDRFLAGAGAIILAWIWTLLWVQRDEIGRAHV